MGQDASNKLSVYLIKEEYTKSQDILKNFDGLQLQDLPGVGTFYFGASHQHSPDWIKNFFGDSLDSNLELFNSTSKAVLLIELDVEPNKKRIFAIPFGYGWTFLNEGVYEERFGLKITLNVVDATNLRRIDKKNMSSVPKDTIEQLSRGGEASDFGIDIEQDLIQSVTGKAKEDFFGNTITGKSSLSVSVKVRLPNIKNFLKKCYEKFISLDYKKDFGWIDQVSEIKDPKLTAILDSKLIENIKKDELDKIWLAVPEIIDWSIVAGFSYKSNKKEGIEDDIRLYSFLDSLPEDKRNNLDLELLKNKRVYCFDANNDEIRHMWRIYDCLYCEIYDEEAKKTYLLSNGNWYEIEKDFAMQVNSDFVKIRNSESEFKIPEYNYKNENEYNKKVAQEDNNFCCMDGHLINHGGGYSKIEFCDLFTKNKKIIHIKRYGGSTVLSHLFSQGTVSGELFLADENFRKKVNDKLPEGYKIENPDHKPTSDDYEIIFGILSSSKNALELPFFSKVTLRNAKRRLETFGYKVSVQKLSADNEQLGDEN